LITRMICNHRETLNSQLTYNLQFNLINVKSSAEL
jgi:hypothetical protein